MLWRVSARLGGIGGVDFNVLGNPAELVSEPKMNADISVFVNLDSNPLQKHTGKRSINLTNNAALENKAAFYYEVTSGYGTVDKVTEKQVIEQEW